MTIREALHSGGPLLLDAAMGTELTRRGADTHPPLWSARALLHAPALVREIHEENVAAGADVLTADTFRLHRRNIERETASRVLVSLAVSLAREAASGIPSVGGPPARQVFVAGSLAPLEDCYRPDLVPDDSALATEHREMADALAAAGCDLILVETMNSVRELLAAVRAALGTGLPVVASMVTDGAGRLLSGEPIEEAAAALLRLSPPPDAAGINCVPARRIGGDLARLRAAAPSLRLSVYANTGRAIDEARGLFTEPVAPEEYALLAKKWIEGGGVALLGSCCGTTAAHTHELRARV